MKDEIMAKEFAEKECCATCKNINHFCKEKCECWTFAMKGFLAGIKAGRPQWHKVVDDDVPDDYRYVWTNVGAGYYDGECWRDEYGRLEGVVAWCEPKFDKE